MLSLKFSQCSTTLSRASCVPFSFRDITMSHSSDQNGWIWNRRTFCLITGASRGLGKCLATQLSQYFGKGSQLVLLARSASGLEQTKSDIQETYPGVHVSVTSIDLAKPDANAYKGVIQSALDEHKVLATEFEQAIIVHNVGSTGNAGVHASKMVDPQPIAEYFSLNVFSAICINAQFLQIFTPSIIDRMVINISSLLGVEAHRGFATHCAGKASRIMFFKVLAAEDPSLRVLSYAPGMLDTDLFYRTRDELHDVEMRRILDDVISQGKLITCEDSVHKMISIITSGQYKSGDHVDYFAV